MRRARSGAGGQRNSRVEAGLTGVVIDSNATSIILGLFTILNGLIFLFRVRETANAKVTTIKAEEEKTKAEEDKIIADGNRRIAASIESLAGAVKSDSENVRLMLAELAAQRVAAQSASDNFKSLADDRTRQTDKQLNVITGQAQTLGTMQTALDAQKVSLDVIQGQGVKLEDLPEEIGKLQQKLASLPKDIKDVLAEDFAALSRKIDEKLSAQPPTPIQVNQTVNPPATPLLPAPDPLVTPIPPSAPAPETSA